MAARHHDCQHAVPRVKFGGPDLDDHVTPEHLSASAEKDTINMIELKLSEEAKPSH